MAAIAFALETEQGMTFLRYWSNADFQAVRRGWLEDVFDGVDPLFKRASSQLPRG